MENFILFLAIVFGGVAVIYRPNTACLPNLARPQPLSQLCKTITFTLSGSEEAGSQSYVPPDEKDDRALKEALDLLRGTITDAAFPPNPKAAGP
jgi:hypothetical protein